MWGAMSIMRFGVNAAPGKFNVFVRADAGTSDKDARALAIAVAHGYFSRGCRVDKAGVAVGSLPESAWGFSSRDWYSGKPVSGWFARQ